MTLAAIDVFHFIEAALRATYFCRLDALAVNDGRAWCRLTPQAAPQTTSQAVVDGFPAALQSPEAEIMINALPLREIRRQHLPRDAPTHQIEDAVEDFAHNQGAWPPAGFRFGDESFNMIPFAISQVA